ncbi:acid-sensing ion channel 3 isoform X3 [Vidua chalybeata]|uniref:acid-sensing ion channel 3 isoform X3 n=1 Tax=Vidua chalybeata TaxID=81927 RepID=UPI0023A8C431|nr:acid-sensing ion channel 3 isoform X3 [Vidua chalybeata]
MRRGSEGSGEGEGLSSLRAFAHSSSLHGISHVFAYGAVSLRRVLWGGFFLGSLGLLLLVCAERVAYFLTYPHVTKLDEVAARNLTFPAITICNLNEFRFSKITRNDMYHVGELLALLNERYEISNPQLAEPHVLAALRDKANFKNFKAKPFSMAEFYNRTGHDLADMLLQCSFRGTGCTARNFTVIFTRLGKCYTFNPGGPGREVLTTLQGGSGNGLELMLNVQQEEYLPVWGDTDETSFEVGVKVQIHSQDEPPFIDQLGFGVAPGFQTFVSCQQQRPDRVPPGLRDALPGRELQLPHGAHAGQCQRLYPGAVQGVRRPRAGLPGDEGQRVLRVPHALRHGALRQGALHGEDPQQGLGQVPGQEVQQDGAVHCGQCAGPGHLLRGTELRDDRAEEGVRGDIGGQMGLFIGASLLTILEIFDYLYEVFRDKLLSLYKEKKRSPRSDGGTLSAWPPLPGPTPRLGVAPNLLPRHPALGSPPGPPAEPSPPPRRPGGWGDTPGPRGGLQASPTP